MSGTRRSARIKTISPSTLYKTPNPAPDHEEEGVPYMSSNDQEPSHQKQPSRKKKSAQTKTNDAPLVKKKRGGKLRKMPDMPLDILFEIFSHLLPYDLLRLSRATKSLRQILMKRSSAFVWKLARGNIPSLPECPPGLSEPAYANLAFDPHCHFCGAQAGNKVSWSLFKRACKGCHATKYSHCYNQITLGALCSDLGIPPDRVLTNADIDCVPCVSKSYSFVWEDLKPVLLEYGAIEDEERRAEWKEMKTAEKAQRYTFATALFYWSMCWKKQRLTDIKDVKERRSTAILDRLTAEGWTDVIDKLNFQDRQEYHKHAVVKQNKDLTDRIWKNIKPQITELFETFRTRQRERDISRVQQRRLTIFEKALDDYYTSLPCRSTACPLRDILILDSVQRLIFDERWDLEFDESAFEETLTLIPELTASWKTELDEHLSQLLTSDEETTSMNTCSDISTFDLATSLFCCEECDECHLTYEQTLVHHCAGWHPPRPPMSSLPSILGSFFPRANAVPDIANFTLCSHRDQMKELLIACGLPEGTMMATLQERNPLVECRVIACDLRKSAANRHAMYWRELLSHNVMHAADMQVLNSADLIGRMFQPPIKNRMCWLGFSDDRRPIFGCKYCYSPCPLNFDRLKNHLSIRHDVEIETRGSMEHYVIHPGAQLSYGVLNERYERVPVVNV